MINAQEARELTKSVDGKIELTRALLDAINDRIKNAANSGKTFITLSSINDAGHGVRGVGHYLSDGVTDALSVFLISKGFKVDYENPFYNTNMVVKVSW